MRLSPRGITVSLPFRKSAATTVELICESEPVRRAAISRWTR